MDNFQLYVLFLLISNLFYAESTCDSGYKTTPKDAWCYKFYSEKQTWNEARQICWDDHSHLIQFQPKHDWDLDTMTEGSTYLGDDKYMWVGLKRVNHVFQWVGIQPMILKKDRNDKWEPRWAKSQPMVWNGCGAIDRQNGQLNATECDDKKLTFICVHRPRVIPPEIVQPAWRFKPGSSESVKIVAKGKDVEEILADDDYILWITEEEEVQKSTLLVCELTIGEEEIKLKENQTDYQFSWIKNGVYMNQPNISVMLPHAWLRAIPWVDRIGRLKETYGTYECEISSNGSLGLRSKPLSIFVKGLQPMKYDVVMDSPKKQKAEIEATSCRGLCFSFWSRYLSDIANQIFLKENYQIFGAKSIDWMLHYIEPVKENELKSGSTVSKIKISFFVVVNKTSDNLRSPLEIRQQFLDRSNKSYDPNFTVLGHCESKVDQGSDYYWSSTRETGRGISDPLCVTAQPQKMVVKRFCNGTYWEKANFVRFNYSVCTLNITHLFEDEICPHGHKLVSDDTCVKNVSFKTKWTTAKVDCTKLGSHLPHNSVDLTSTNTSVGGIVTSWSLARLNGRKIYPPQPNQSTGQCNMTNCCVVLNSTNWQPANCEQKQSFICVSRIQDSLWKVPWCPRGWWGTEISSLKHNCYFISPKISTESERKNACTKRGARLANITNPLLHVLIKNVLRRVIVPGKRVEFLNETGFINIDFLVCEDTTIKSPRKPRLILRSTKSGTKDNPIVNLTCHGTNVRPNSRVIWYQNGDPYPQLQPKDIPPTDTDLLAAASVNLVEARQGDYWCEAWDKNGRDPILSNKVTLVLPSINNCVIVLKIGNSTRIDPFFNLVEPNIRRQESTLLDDGQLFVWVYVHVNSQRTPEEAVNLVQSEFGKHLNLSSKDIAETFLVRSTERCLPDKTTSLGRTLNWPITTRMRAALPKELCSTSESAPVYRECIGDFRRGAFWGPVVGECDGKLTELTTSLYELSQTKVTEDSAFGISNQLHQLTQDTNINFYPVDVAYIAQMMKEISGTGNVTNQTFVNIVLTVNRVMTIDSDVLSSQQELQSTNKITKSIEQIVETVELEPGTAVQYSSPNIYVEAHLMSEDETIVGLASSDHKQSFITPNTSNPIDVDVSLVLPTDFIKHRKDESGPEGLRIGFSVYHNSRLFVPSKTSSSSPSVISKIISAQLPGFTVINLKKPVEIRFKPIPEVIEQGIILKPELVSCVYWDPDLNQNQGDWSAAGCKVFSANITVVICKCNHLTNFAVLMDVYGQTERVVGIHREILDTITYVGCALSITGLSVTVLTFLLFSKWRKKDGNKIVFNLALALLLLMLTFLAGIQQTGDKTICKIVAILLHYFILVAFCWMLVEAVQQYLLFVRVLATYIPRFLLKSIIFAWGLPLIIVITVVGIDNEQYEGGDHYCWMQLTALYYAFLLPLGIIITINSIVFILVLRGITCGRRTQLRSNQSKQQLMKTQIYAAIFIFVLLGLSWIFGFLAIEGARLTFQYIFCISNSLQGLLIFIFMVVRDRNAQDLWQTFCMSKDSKKVGVSTSGGMHQRREEPNSDNFTTKLMVSRTSLHPSQ